MKKLLMTLAFKAMQIKWRLLRPVTLGVRILLVHDHQVVLIKHTYLPGWHLPGGKVDRGETLAQAAAREANEEVGAELTDEPKLLEVITTFTDGKSDHAALYFSNSFTLNGARDSWEIEKIELFSLDQLPVASSRMTKKAVALYQELLKTKD